MIKACLLMALLGVSAHDHVASGNAAYRAGRYREAISAYRGVLAVSPGAAEAWFDLGAALYRLGDFAGAENSWERASRASNDRKFTARCRYNQGNAIYRRAVELSSRNVEHAMTALGQAIDMYTTVLNLDPQFNAARYNRDAAASLSVALKEGRIQDPIRMRF